MVRPDLTRMSVAQFEKRARKTDQLEPALDTAVLGLVGEVGSLVSALKKKRRDTDGYFGYHDAVVEELGDVLWYLSAIAARGGTSLVEIIGRAAGMTAPFDELRFSDLSGPTSSSEESFETALLELAGEAGDLAKRFAVRAYLDNVDAL